MQLEIYLPTRFGVGTVSHGRTVYLSPAVVTAVLGPSWYEENGQIVVCDNLGSPLVRDDGEGPFEVRYTAQSFAEKFLRDDVPPIAY